MEIYLVIGLVSAGMVAFGVSRFPALPYLLLVPAMLMLSGCLSLRLGDSDKPQATGHQTADVRDLGGAQAAGLQASRPIGFSETQGT